MSSIIATTTKFTDGAAARKMWCKDISSGPTVSVDAFNNACGGVFIKAADIILDDSTKRSTVITCDPTNAETWKENAEQIYVIVKDGFVMKIGGTRTGMKSRWSSYICGHHVTERGKSGKMSVTNAHLYHTIESGLLTGDKWEFYIWTIPTVTVSVDILGKMCEIKAQTYHAYESRSMSLFKTLSGGMSPTLSENCDPGY